MAKKTLRIGLIGVGAAAQVNHIPALKKIEGLELVALCDHDPEKAQRVAQKFGIPRAVARVEETAVGAPPASSAHYEFAAYLLTIS